MTSVKAVGAGMGWDYLALAVVVAVAQPLLFVVVRHEIRFGRLRALYEFDVLFNISQDKESNTAPTFEYVRARYTDDIEFPTDFPVEWIRSFDMSKEKFRDFIRKIRCWQLKSSRSLLFSSLLLTCLIAFGFAVLFNPPYGPSRIFNFDAFASPLLIDLGLSDASAAKTLARNVTVVAEAAFVGAYLFTSLLFLRALATFDLSPLTWLRGTIYFVAGILGAVMLYLAFPDIPTQTIEAARSVAHALKSDKPSPAQGIRPAELERTDQARATKISAPTIIYVESERKSDEAATHPTVKIGARKPISGIWVVLAFLIGFTPDLALNAMAARVQRTLKIKMTDDRLIAASKSTPLEMIDGIDVLTRFRLQESNIFEVQNLAVSNPIMLFIETPFGIYQVIDWVAQAQLCVAVGPERFLDMQRHGFRTIFDLERAVLSVYTTSQLRRYVASLLLSTMPNAALDGIEPAARGGVAVEVGGGVGARSAEAFSTFAANAFSMAAISHNGTTKSEDPDETIKHFVRIMVDDLHVCRLRQVWQQIMSKIDGMPISANSPDRLWDTEWTPPLPSGFEHPPYPGR